MIAEPTVIPVLLGRSGVPSYLAVGGRCGKDSAFPTLSGAPVIRPVAIGTAIIALELTAMAVTLCLRTVWLGAPDVPRADDFIRSCTWLIAAVSAAPAVSDLEQRSSIETPRLFHASGGMSTG